MLQNSKWCFWMSIFFLKFVPLAIWAEIVERLFFDLEKSRCLRWVDRFQQRQIMCKNSMFVSTLARKSNVFAWNSKIITRRTGVKDYVIKQNKW